MVEIGQITGEWATADNHIAWERHHSPGQSVLYVECALCRSGK